LAGCVCVWLGVAGRVGWRAYRHVCVRARARVFVHACYVFARASLCVLGDGSVPSMWVCGCVCVRVCGRACLFVLVAAFVSVRACFGDVVLTFPFDESIVMLCVFTPTRTRTHRGRYGHTLMRPRACRRGATLARSVVAVQLRPRRPSSSRPTHSVYSMGSATPETHAARWTCSKCRSRATPCVSARRRLREDRTAEMYRSACRLAACGTQWAAASTTTPRKTGNPFTRLRSPCAPVRLAFARQQLSVERTCVYEFVGACCGCVCVTYR
jgi:hypothetical protein